jgi:hypothetical protein
MEGREERRVATPEGSRGWCERTFLPDGLRLLTTVWEPRSGGRVQLIDLQGRLLWQGRRGLYDVRPAADGVHYAAVSVSEDGEREVIVGALGSQQAIVVAKGARPYWSPQPSRRGD